MKIGLLSDTHSHLDPRVLVHFEKVDEVWHAGDIGDPTIADQLENFKPFKAVFGNIDEPTIQRRFPEDLKFICEGLNIWITHIGGTPPKYNPRVKKELSIKPPDVFVCGHSHILKIQKDSEHNKMLYLNPGAAGNHGFHHVKTIVRFEINAKKVENLQVIELGRRGALK